MSFDIELYKSISEAIEKNYSSLAKDVVAIQYGKFPESLAPYGERGKIKSIDDAEYTIKYLSEAIALGDQLLFTQYILWLNGVLAGVNVPADIMFNHVTILKKELVKQFPPDFSSVTSAFLDHPINALEGQ